MQLPRLYPILDADTCRAHNTTPAQIALELAAAGVQLAQYRDKQGSPQTILCNAATLREAFGPNATLLMNDRVDLAILANFNGVHLGQEDLPFADARSILPSNSIIGLSTHTPDELLQANETSADYLAIGPIFSTSTKLDAAPVVGLEGLRRARALTTRPLVAIGGITLANAASVFAAGADSIAVISGLFSPTETIEQVARDFMRL
jgi:thiamine-phosphate pyrophosphorylase